MPVPRNSPSRTAGIVSKEVTLGDTVYLLSQPDRVRKAADEESVILSRRLDMLPAIVAATASIPDAAERAAWRKDYIDSVLPGIASPKEWSNYYQSVLWPIAFRLWHHMDDKHRIQNGRLMPLLDGVKWCYEIVNGDGITVEQLDSLELAIRFVSQEDALGKSSGQSPILNTQLTGTPATAAGQQFTPGE